MTKETIDYWYSHVTGSEDLSTVILDRLHKEFPLFISWVGERTCNLQCMHCIFQEEKSFGEGKEIEGVLLNLISQVSMHHQPIVIHEGRILRRWHLPIMSMLQKGGASVGLIDNGTYLSNLDHFEQKLDWIDFSIDGTRDIHDLQRNYSGAYQAAINGLKKTREVAHKVTSLFTLTSINYHDIYNSVSEIIDMVDEVHITPVSPVRSEIECTESSVEQFKIAWIQIQKLISEYPSKVFVRMYRHEDLIKLSAINPEAFSEAVHHPIGASQGRIMFNVHGVPVSYLPKSLSINETIVVDVDGWYRLPYSIAYTIKELSSGIDRFGNDISKYSLQELKHDSNIEMLYQRAVSAWWKQFAKQSLYEERKAINVHLKQSL